MQKVKFLLIILIFLVSINATYANELESNDTNKLNFDNPNTDTDKISYNNNQDSNNLKIDTTNNEYYKPLKYKNTNKTDNIPKTTTNNEKNETNTSIKFDNSTTKNQIIKDTTNIFIETTKLKSRDTLIIYLKNSNNAPLINKQISININNKEYSVFTNSEGIANLKLTLTPQEYDANIQFKGDDELNPQTKNIKIQISKLSTKISYYANYVVKKGYLYIYLLGEDGEGIFGKLKIKLRKRNFVRTSNKNGRIRIKINSKPGKYSIKIKYNGNTYFKASSKKMNFYVTQSLFYIVNKKIVKNGYLRLYLKGKKRTDISKKKFLIKIGGQKYYTKTNHQGLAIIKVNVPSGTYNTIVKHGKYHIIKKINCIEDYVKNPLENNISLVNGAPDLDYMPANYVMADTKATYTLTRKQYLEVIKRDSYCLFLNNKLSRYVLFRTASRPHTYHIIKREKWNVIEKAINKKLVSKNKYRYWPKKIKISLKGKSYKYSEVRDVQNKGYTCGPTSASVCSQVLRNYLPEGYLSKRSHTTKSGTKIQNLEKVLYKHNFKCTHFYKNSFNTALNELKKGGCAVIFHSQHHYVTIIDISKNGKRVLVSNSYGNYNKIPSKWVSTYYMRHKFGVWDDSLIVRLNYKLNNSTKNSINCFYNSMGKNWNRHNLREKI